MTKFFDIRPPHPKSKPAKSASSAATKRAKKSSSGTFLLILIILLVFVFYFSVNNNNQTNYKQENNNSNTIADETANPLENLAASPTETASSEPTPSLTPTVQGTQTEPEPDYSNIKISVLNGAGVPGLATKIKLLLEENGYKVAEVGNAQNTYQETILYCTPKNHSLAEKIKNVLKDYQVQITENDTLATDESILVVMGAK
jgi:hypothetical protein